MENFRREKAPQGRFEEASNFEELVLLLDSISGLQGSGAYYTSPQLKDLISDVRAGKSDANVITSTDGLRDRVRELIEKESGTAEPDINMPLPSESITLTKVYMTLGAESQALPGDILDGILLNEIKIGEPVLLFGGKKTSNVKSIDVRSDGKILLQTESGSTYLVTQSK